MSDSNNTIEISSWDKPITEQWQTEDLSFLKNSGSADIAEKIFYTSDPQFLLATLTELMNRGIFRKAAEVTRILVQTIPDLDSFVRDSVKNNDEENWLLDAPFNTIPESPLDFSPDVHIKYIE